MTLFYVVFSQLSYHKQTYGTSIISSKTNFAESIIENPEILKVHQQQQQHERVRKALLSQQLNSPSGVKKGLKSPSHLSSRVPGKLYCLNDQRLAYYATRDLMSHSNHSTPGFFAMGGAILQWYIRLDFI